MIDLVLAAVIASSARPRVLVVDSSSTDGTLERARAAGADVLRLPRGAFDHGATREMARCHLGAEIVVMLTQDAVPRGGDAIDTLLAPVIAGCADAAYGRQVPRPGASEIERFARDFNYPPRSELRDRRSIVRLGVRAFFMSNAFAAYRMTALDGIGGFRPTLSHEDALAAAALLRAGCRVAYVAEAVAEHSHEISVRGEFVRYVEAGYARARCGDALRAPGGHSGEGRRFAVGLLRHVARRAPGRIPQAAGSIAARAAGFHLGALSARRGPWVARALSPQSGHWRRQEAAR